MLKSKLRFFNQLADLSAAGVDWEYIVEKCEQKFASSIDIHQLQISFKFHPHLSPFERTLLATGVKTGALSDIAKALARKVESQIKVRTKAILMSLYPLLLLAIIVFGLPVINIPQDGMYGYTSEVLKSVLVIAAISISTYFLITKTGLYYKIPLLKNYLFNRAAENLFFQLYLYSKTDITEPKAWELVSESASHPLVSSFCAEAISAINHGERASKGLSKVAPIDIVSHYSIGEKSGTLETNLQSLYTTYQEKTQTSYTILFSAATGLFMATVGGLAVYKIISFYTGYLNQILQILG